jgi:hypothetical protein
MLNQKLYNRLKMSFWRSLMPCKSEASPMGITAGNPGSSKSKVQSRK